jgi:hypothetical protein
MLDAVFSSKVAWCAVWWCDVFAWCAVAVDHIKYGDSRLAVRQSVYSKGYRLVLSCTAGCVLMPFSSYAACLGST